jgi:hypothetical protein
VPPGVIESVLCFVRALCVANSPKDFGELLGGERHIGRVRRGQAMFKNAAILGRCLVKLAYALVRQPAIVRGRQGQGAARVIGTDALKRLDGRLRRVFLEQDRGAY